MPLLQVRLSHQPPHTFYLPLCIGESEDPDFAEDALSPEYVKLLKTITREEVDKYTTRCPHGETSEKMTEVRSFQELIHMCH